ncbi:MAG: hypothetical protein NT007_12510 [Candidatus Kapabacteria bacterium]|nr:hypothetical protein [Candidatus Kapabacteria bacterium]
MKKLQFKIIINANVEKVWHTIFDADSYRKWTEVFQKGSCFEGSWDKGSEIRFLAPDENGKMMGMYSFINENIKYKFVSIHHKGLIISGVVDTSNEDFHKWSDSYENYTLNELDSDTELITDMCIPEEYMKMMEETWPLAQQALKSLCEL